VKHVCAALPLARYQRQDAAVHSTEAARRIADLERRLAAEQARRLIAEQRATELRRAMLLLVRQLKAAQADG
jgi:hypothetical protein